MVLGAPGWNYRNGSNPRLVLSPNCFWPISTSTSLEIGWTHCRFSSWSSSDTAFLFPVRRRRRRSRRLKDTGRCAKQKRDFWLLGNGKKILALKLGSEGPFCYRHCPNPSGAERFSEALRPKTSDGAKVGASRVLDGKGEEKTLVSFFFWGKAIRIKNGRVWCKTIVDSSRKMWLQVKSCGGLPPVRQLFCFSGYWAGLLARISKGESEIGVLRCIMKHSTLVEIFQSNHLKQQKAPETWEGARNRRIREKSKNCKPVRN